MPIINVKKGFNIRFESGKAVKSFSPGEHSLTPEQANNWFIKAAVQAGRATLSPDPAADPAAGPVANPAADPVAGPATDPVATPEEAVEKLVFVFPQVTKDDLKADGTPTVAACSRLLGTTVTAAQVAAAWAVYKDQE